MLSQAAEQLRQPFLNLITKLGRHYNSIAWWTSRLSERNTMVSPLFLYCCYLQIAHEAFNSIQGTLCVVAESWAVLESLAEIARKRNSRVMWLTRPILGQHQALFLARIGKRLACFIGKAFWLKFQRDSMAHSVSTSQPSVLLRTYLDDASFGEDGVFHDRYLPGLCHWLEAQGFVVTTIPVLFNVKRSYSSAWQWLRDSRQQFLNPFKHYRLVDYLFVLRQAWQQLRMPEGPLDLDGLDVSRLFEAERKHAAFDVGSLNVILSYRLPHRLANAGLPVDLFIDEFENMNSEKGLTLGFRRYLPDTKLVGFQHGALFPLLLCLFITPGEAEFAPMPDRVVCNGEFFREILIREGLPPERAVVGPALRYAHLWQRAETDVVKPDGRACILVPFSLVLHEAVELLIKVIDAFGHLNDLQVMLKPHPMSSSEALLRAARLKELPLHFEFIGGGMGKWLAQADIVIAMGSSTIYEALAAALPVIVVGCETALNRNPLAWYTDLNRVVYTPQEIRAEAQRYLALSLEDKALYQQRAKEVLYSSFGPVTDDAMRAFVDGFLSMDHANSPDKVGQ